MKYTNEDKVSLKSPLKYCFGDLLTMWWVMSFKRLPKEKSHQKQYRHSHASHANTFHGVAMHTLCCAHKRNPDDKRNPKINDKRNPEYKWKVFLVHRWKRIPNFCTQKRIVTCVPALFRVFSRFSSEYDKLIAGIYFFVFFLISREILNTQILHP